MKGIYKMSIDCDRMGSIDGVFVAEDTDVAKLLKNRTTIYFGEILGKHSDVQAEIEEEDLDLMTQDENFIALFEKLNLSTGYDPFDYLEKSDLEGDDEEDEDDE